MTATLDGFSVGIILYRVASDITKGFLISENPSWQFPEKRVFVSLTLNFSWDGTKGLQEITWINKVMMRIMLITEITINLIEYTSKIKPERRRRRDLKLQMKIKRERNVRRISRSLILNRNRFSTETSKAISGTIDRESVFAFWIKMNRELVMKSMKSTRHCARVWLIMC